MKAVCPKNAVVTWVFMGKQYDGVKRALGLKTAIRSSISDSSLLGDDSSWIFQICVHLGSEILTVLYSGLCFQRCLDSK